MRNKNLLILVILFVLVFLSLISCTANTELTNAPTVPAKTIVPTNTVAKEMPTKTSIASPTNTTVPPTATPFLGGKIAFWDSDIKIFAATSKGVQTIFQYGQNVDGISVSPSYSNIAWSPDGHWIAFTASDIRANVWIYAYDDIYVAKSDGSQVKRLTFSPNRLKNSLSWSPNGNYILASIGGETGILDIYILNAKNGKIYRRLTVSVNGNSNFNGIWSPDGERIAFTSEKSLFIMDADGKNQNLVRDFSPETPCDLSWSPDGSIIALNVNVDNGNIDVYSNLFIIKPDGTDLKQLTDTPHLKSSPSWSPDGKYIVFSNAPYTYGEQATGWNMHITNLLGDEEMVLSDIHMHAKTVWSPVPALKIGNNYAITKLSDNLNLHSSASLTSEIINKLKIGESFTVLDGPVDTENYYWWKIRTTDGTEGWIVEMAYWYKLLNP